MTTRRPGSRRTYPNPCLIARPMLLPSWWGGGRCRMLIAAMTARKLTVLIANAQA